jgi:hypothetical protein
MRIDKPAADSDPCALFWLQVMADLQRLVQKHVDGEQPVIHHPFAGKQDEE